MEAVAEPVLGLFHINIMTPDLPKSKAFYLAIGCRLIAEWEFVGVGDEMVRFPSAMLAVGGSAHIELSQQYEDEIPSSGLIHHFSLQFENAEKAYSQALAAGAEPHEMVPGWGPPKEIVADRLNFRVGVVVGPSGEIIEILQQRT